MDKPAYVIGPRYLRFKWPLHISLVYRIPRRFSPTRTLGGFSEPDRMACPTEISSEEDTRSGDLAVRWRFFILPATDVTAAIHLLVPIQAPYYALQGTNDLQYLKHLCCVDLIIVVFGCII